MRLNPYKVVPLHGCGQMMNQDKKIPKSYAIREKLQEILIAYWKIWDGESTIRLNSILRNASNISNAAFSLCTFDLPFYIPCFSESILTNFSQKVLRISATGCQ